MDAGAGAGADAAAMHGQTEEAGSGGAGAPGGRRFRPDIQGIRALAVLLVVANHAGIPGFAGGYVGVDMFFVVSGYVITQLLLRETGKGARRGLADFYSRRVRRIVPAATATLVATVVVAGALLGPHTNPDLPGDVRWASLFAANFRLIRTGSNYFVPGLQPSLITQFWSLAVEEQFYLAFPMLVFSVTAWAHAHRRLRRDAALAVAISAGMIASFAWSVYLTSARPAAAYYSPFTRFWELGLGCLLAVVTAGRPAPSVRAGTLAATAGTVLLIVALAVLGPTSAYPGWLALLPCGSAALLLWGGSAGAGRGVPAVLSTRPLVYVGNISYSLYLTHFAWLNLPEQLPHPLLGWGWRVVEIAGSFATAMASYHLLENPVRHSTRLARDRVAVALLLAACVAASWTASIVVSHLLV